MGLERNIDTAKSPEPGLLGNTKTPGIVSGRSNFAGPVARAHPSGSAHSGTNSSANPKERVMPAPPRALTIVTPG